MKHNLRYISYIMILVVLSAVLGYFDNGDHRLLIEHRTAAESRVNSQLQPDVRVADNR